MSVRNVLTIDKWVLELERKGVELFLRGNQLAYRAARNAMDDELLGELKARKAELLEFLQAKSEEQGREIDGLKDGSSFPLTYAQRSFWSLEKELPGNPYSNLINVVSIWGEIDLSAMHAAFEGIVNQHPALRTTISEEDGRPVQRVNADLPHAIKVEDLGELSQEEGQTSIARTIFLNQQLPFDLQNGPLYRATLLVMDQQKAVLVFATHHIICDEWSFELFNQELFGRYEAVLAGKPYESDRSGRSMGEHAIWQEKMVGEGTWTRQIEYWTKKLQATQENTSAELGPHAGGAEYFEVAYHRFELKAEVLEGVRSLLPSAGCTSMMVFLAALEVALAKWCDRPGVPIGTLATARLDASLEYPIGLYLNTLVFAPDLSGDPSLREALLRIRSEMLMSYRNQDVPFEYLLESLGQVEGFEPSKLFRVMFLHHTMGKTHERGGLFYKFLDVSRLIEKPRIPTSFDLIFSVEERETGIHVTAVYKSAKYKAELIQQFCAAYAEVLRSLIETPDKALSAPFQGGYAEAAAEFGTLFNH